MPETVVASVSALSEAVDRLTERRLMRRQVKALAELMSESSSGTVECLCGFEIQWVTSSNDSTTELCVFR